MKPWTLRSALLVLLLIILPQRPEAQVKSVAVGGTELAYLDLGQGPPVVMVHGTISDHRWWKAQMDEFSQRHRVIAYSLRHHYPNVSIGDRSDYLPRTHAADLAGLIQVLNLARTHLIGHSYGGFISLLVARDRPELVRSLVLVEPARLAGLITGTDAEEAKPILKGIGEFRSKCWSGSLKVTPRTRCGSSLTWFVDLGRGKGCRTLSARRGATTSTPSNQPWLTPLSVSPATMHGRSRFRRSSSVATRAPGSFPSCSTGSSPACPASSGSPSPRPPTAFTKTILPISTGRCSGSWSGSEKADE